MNNTNKVWRVVIVIVVIWFLLFIYVYSFFTKLETQNSNKFKHTSQKVEINYSNKYIIRFENLVNDTIIDNDIVKTYPYEIKYWKGDTLKKINGNYNIDTLTTVKYLWKED